MCRNKILLSNSQIHQIIERISTDKIESFLQLGAEASTEAFTLLSVGIRIMTSILTQVIKSLGILEYGSSALSQSQKLIEFTIKKSSRDMMSSKGILELIPIYHMTSR